jgi:hypothetical protein
MVNKPTVRLEWLNKAMAIIEQMQMLVNTCKPRLSSTG